MNFITVVFSAAIGPRGIRVNTVNPATVKTDMFNKPDGPGGNAEKKQAVSDDPEIIVCYDIANPLVTFLSIILFFLAWGFKVHVIFLLDTA